MGLCTKQPLAYHNCNQSLWERVRDIYLPPIPAVTFLFDLQFSDDEATDSSRHYLWQSSQFHYSRGTKLSRLWTSLWSDVYFLMQRAREQRGILTNNPIWNTMQSSQAIRRNSPRQRTLICQSISPLRNHEPSARTAETVCGVRNAYPVIPN